MNILTVKVFLALLLFSAGIEFSFAQYNTPYKKQIKYFLDDEKGNKSGFKFQFQNDDKNNLYVNFTVLDSSKWNIELRNDSVQIGNYTYPFDIIHQIGTVKPGKSEQICIIVVSATGGNGIVTNEFTTINPDFDTPVNVQINYLIKQNSITYNYNRTSLDLYRSNEIRFITGLVGEYNMIWYEGYKEKK